MMKKNFYKPFIVCIALSILSLIALIPNANAQMIVQVGAGQTYTTLKAAFDDINAGMLYDDIELQITSSITETISPSLNNSGVGSAYYTSITIYPINPDCVIECTATGANQGVVIFNGAQNVTIDGRLNGTGDPYNLTLIHNGTQNSPTIRFTNKARFNTIQYCNLQHYFANQATGIINIAQAVDTSIANAYNTIQYNNFSITNTATYGPNMIWIGNNAHANIIHGNNFIDYIYKYGLGAGVNAAAIIINGNTFANEITENSFYTTAVFTPANSINQSAIYIGGTTNNAALTPNLISGNYIGGTAPMAGGAPMEINVATANTKVEFIGILAEGDNASSVFYNVENNTITNLKILNSRHSAAGWDVSGETYSYGFIGIYNKWGKVNITNNVIGDTTGNDHIELTFLNNNSRNFGILIENASPNVDGNQIGGITLTHLTTNQYADFVGIGKANPRHYGPSASPTGHPIINNNFIGSATTPHSIRNTSTGTTNIFQYTTGIETTHNEDMTITNNHIHNLTNYSNKTSATDSGGAFGIAIKGNSIATVTGNEISNITGTCNSTSTRYCSATGILIHPWTSKPAFTVSENTIKNIISSSTGTTQTSACGITISATAILFGQHLVSKNFIYNVQANSTNTNTYIAGIYGISGITNTQNNVIAITNSLGKVYGIYGTNASHNTIYLTNTNPTLSESACLYESSIARNNILYNGNAVPSGNPPRHYAFRKNSGASTGLVQNNNYFVSNPSAGGRLLHFNGTVYDDLAIWETVIPPMDTASISANPNFVNPTGSNAVDFKAGNNFAGVVLGDILTDFENLTRVFYTMGAFDIDYVLSIEGLSFDIKMNDRHQPEIHWTNLNEDNTHYYTIESSNDAISWNMLTTQKAEYLNGNYAYTDINPLTKKRFYRIAKTDLSGKVHYSDIKWVDINAGSTIQIYPNPAKENINIQGIENGDIIRIIDITGKVIVTETANTDKHSIAIHQYHSGNYCITISKGSEVKYSGVFTISK